MAIVRYSSQKITKIWPAVSNHLSIQSHKRACFFLSNPGDQFSPSKVILLAKLLCPCLDSTKCTPEAAAAGGGWKIGLSFTEKESSPHAFFSLVLKQNNIRPNVLTNQSWLHSASLRKALQETPLEEVSESPNMVWSHKTGSSKRLTKKTASIFKNKPDPKSVKDKVHGTLYKIFMIFCSIN